MRGAEAVDTLQLLATKIFRHIATQGQVFFVALRDFLDQIDSPVVPSKETTSLGTTYFLGRLPNSASALEERVVILLCELTTIAMKESQHQFRADLLKFMARTIIAEMNPKNLSLISYSSSSFLLISPNAQLYVDDFCRRMTRLYVSLARVAGEIQRVRILCFDIMRHQRTSRTVIPIFCNLVFLWPEVISPPSPPSGLPDTEALILKVIKCILFSLHLQSLETPMESEKEKLQVMEAYNTIEGLCGWTDLSLDFKQGTPESLCNSLVALINTTTEKLLRGESLLHTDFSFALEKSIELSAHILGWVVVYNSIIIEKLWPIIQGGDQGPKMVFAILLIGTLGRIGLQEEGTLPPEELGLDNLRGKFLDVLSFPLAKADTDKPTEDDGVPHCNFSSSSSFFFLIVVTSLRIILSHSHLPGPVCCSYVFTQADQRDEPQERDPWKSREGLAADAVA